MISTPILGIIIALVASASWSLCAIFYKLLGQKIDSIGLNTIKSILSFILLLLALLISKTNILIESDIFIRIAISGIIGIVIGDSLFFAALKRLSPFILSLIYFIGPVIFSGIVGFLYFNERPTYITSIGILITLLGISFFLNIKKNETNIEETKTKLSGIVLAVFSIICTISSIGLLKPILNDVPTATVTMYRMLVSAICLILFGIITKKYKEWKKSLSEKKYNIKLFSTISLETFGGFWLSLTAIKYCHFVVISTIYALEPLFIIIFMLAINKYKLIKKEIYGFILSIIGIILIFKG